LRAGVIWRSHDNEGLAGTRKALEEGFPLSHCRHGTQNCVCCLLYLGLAACYGFIEAWGIGDVASFILWIVLFGVSLGLGWADSGLRWTAYLSSTSRAHNNRGSAQAYNSLATWLPTQQHIILRVFWFGHFRKRGSWISVRLMGG
jgi:hypothetical protein